MRSTAWRWVVRLGLALSAGCFCLWAYSLSVPFQTVPTFLETGRPAAIVSGFVYVNVSQPLTASEQSVVRRMDALEQKVIDGEAQWPTSTQTSSGSGSGDRWIVFGWSRQWSIHRIGPYSITTGRSAGLWISPWAGVLAGFIPFAITWCIQSRRRYVMENRQSEGRCLQCGYNLRGSTDRCPECGSPIASA